ncbi:uncharacterized protein LOC132200794 [Neocloeon triangulifer]|uniref:uncharacterized protein LOC132200794 n=1 Tax=Neocloeon triangulifer TaxID=2078957 RepID=UPI00286F4402|nr:uncharacterized protein LOC132200794 [Neocloeon triangulifer]
MKRTAVGKNVADEWMERQKNVSAAAVWKLKALQTGDGTDCVFLVGPDDESAKLVHGSKFDLRAASEYFRGLFRSSLLIPSEPIRVKHVEPSIFKMVIEFAHTRVHTPVTNIQEAVKLARVADEFLMDELGAESTALIEHFLTPENVWKVMEQSHLNKFVASACKKFLIGRTLECLEQSTFLEIGFEVLGLFLALDKMAINSELDLIASVVKLANSKKEDGDKRAVIQASLPHLRLLTVTEKGFAMLYPWLTDQEKFFFLHKLAHSPLLANHQPERPESICPILQSRCAIKTFTLIPESAPLSARKIFEDPQLCREITKSEEFVLSFEAKELFCIHGFEVLCKVNLDLSLLDQMEDMKTASQVELLDYCQRVQYENNLLGVKLTISCVGNPWYPGKVIAPTTSDQFATGSSVRFEMPAVLVPKGATVKIIFKLKESCYYKRTNLPKVLVINGITMLKHNAPGANKIFGDLQVQNNKILDYSPSKASKPKPEGEALCLVKNLRYSLV